MGEELQGEYESLRKTVKDRLGHLVHSTGALLENGEGGCPPSPPLQCTEVIHTSDAISSHLCVCRSLESV